MSSFREADSAKELARKGLHAVARTVLAVVVFSVLLVIGVFEIVIGITKVGSCPINPLIPSWLTVSGSLSCLRNIIGIVLSIWGYILQEVLTVLRYHIRRHR